MRLGKKIGIVAGIVIFMLMIFLSVYSMPSLERIDFEVGSGIIDTHDIGDAEIKIDSSIDSSSQFSSDFGSVVDGNEIPGPKDDIEIQTNRTLQFNSTIAETTTILISKCNACLHIQPEKVCTKTGISEEPIIHDWWDPVLVNTPITHTHSHHHPEPDHGHAYSSISDSYSGHCKNEHQEIEEGDACAILHVGIDILDAEHLDDNHYHSHEHIHNGDSEYWTLEEYVEYTIDYNIPEQKKLIIDESCSAATQIIIQASNPENFPICDFAIEIDTDCDEWSNHFE